MLNLKNVKRGYELHIPTKFSEINFEALKDVISNVNVSEYYAVIALCQSFGTFQLATLGAKSNKDMNIPVSCNFVKANDPNNKINANAGDKLIISRSDLEMSVHLPINFGLSTSVIASTIEENPEVRTALRNGPADENGRPINELIAVEFKLVPLTAIKAVLSREKAHSDIYKSVIKEEAAE